VHLYYNKLYILKCDYVYQTLRERIFSFSSSGEKKGQSDSTMWFVHSGC